MVDGGSSSDCGSRKSTCHLGQQCSRSTRNHDERNGRYCSRKSEAVFEAIVNPNIERLLRNLDDLGKLRITRKSGHFLPKGWPHKKKLVSPLCKPVYVA